MVDIFNILLVDKDAKGLELLKEVLVSTGYRADTASDGNSALEKIEGGRPDLVISEINLPEMDGWELCWIIRQRPDLSDIPFIFLTAKTGISDEVFSFELGADDFIKKPFIRNELLARVKGLLARVERSRHSSQAGLTGVRGALKDIALTDILQLMSMGRRTAAVHLSRGESRGSVFIIEGKIVHARYGDIKGEEALFHLLSWDGGNFSVETGATTNIRTVNLPTEAIILEGFRRMDEGKRRGTPPAFETMKEGEALTLKTLFDLGIIVEKGREQK